MRLNHNGAHRLIPVHAHIMQAVELWGSHCDEEKDRCAAELVHSGGGTSASSTTPSSLRRLSLDLSRARVD